MGVIWQNLRLARPLRDARVTRAACALVVALAASAHAVAQPVPQLSGPATLTVQRGTAVDVTITGDHLEGAQQLVVIDTGGTAIEVPAGEGAAAPFTFKPQDTDKQVQTQITAAEAKKVTAKLTIAADAALGDRDVRLITPLGVSNALTLRIIAVAELAEKEPNNSLGEPQDITLPAVIAGAMQSGGDVDYFRFNATKGQRLIFNVWASRIGSKLDSSIDLTNAAGRVLAGNEDYHGTDSLVDFTVPADGQYVLRVRDLRYQGGGDFYYRLHAGPTPYADALFPLGGQRGKPVEFNVVGANVPQAKLKMLIDPATPLGPTALRAVTAGRLTNPAVFEVSDLPDFIESEPNNDAGHANAVTPPVVINGRIGAAGDVDTFKFNSGEYTHLIFEVTAQRAGSPLDALLTLGNAGGGAMQRNDDTSGIDARIDFNKLEKNKDYTIAIRDLLGRGGGSFVYRLSLAPPPSADFAVRFTPDLLRVSRGGNVPVWCQVQRRAGFAGDVTVALSNLPKGVTAEPVTFASEDPSERLFVISAAPDAPMGTAAIELAATGKLAGGDATRAGQSEDNGQPAHRAYLTVLDKAPFAVHPPGPQSEQDKAKLAARIKALQATLDTTTPELAKAQAQWEKTTAGAAWIVLDAVEVKSKGGATFTKQPDGSYLLSGTAPPTDVYSFAADTTLQGITAVQVEALADASLAANGPGRAPNGNFVLSEVAIEAVSAKDAKQKKAIELHKPTADFSQSGYDVAEAINGQADNKGWAVAPQFGKDHFAILQCKQPAGFEGGTRLNFTLSQLFGGQHTIGRLRLSVTTAPDPAKSAALPANVAAALKAPPDQRNDQQKNELAAYYRSIAPGLEPVRKELATLQQTQSGDFPPTVARKKSTSLLVTVDRAPGFTGDVVLSIEGFSTGRDNKNLPNPFTKNFDAKPVTLSGQQSRGTLDLKAKDNAEVGTRPIVIKAQTRIDGYPVTQYSTTLPLTVTEK